MKLRLTYSTLNWCKKIEKEKKIRAQRNSINIKNSREIVNSSFLPIYSSMYGNCVLFLLRTLKIIIIISIIQGKSAILVALQCE